MTYLDKTSTTANTRTGSKTVDRALELAESAQTATTSAVTLAALDELIRDLWKAGEEYQQEADDGRFAALSEIVGDYLRGIRDTEDLRRALEDTDAEVPPR